MTTATDFQKSLYSTFINELEEYSNELDSDIIALEKNPDDDELINRIFRAYHSIKSSAGIVGLSSLSDFTHIVETVMEKIRQKELALSTEIVNALLDSNDILRHFLVSMQEDSNSGSVITDEIVNKIAAVEKVLSVFHKIKRKPAEDKKNTVAEKTESKTAFKYYDIFFKPSADFFETGNDPILYIKDLIENGDILSIKIIPKNLPYIDKIDPHKSYLSWNIIYSASLSKTDITDLFMFIIDDSEITINEFDLSFLNRNDEDTKKLIEKSLLEQKTSTLGEIIDTLKSEKSNATDKPSEDNKIQEEDICDDEENNSDDEKAAVKQKDEVIKNVEKIDYVKVDIRKLDELLNLIGEMVINYSQISTLILTSEQFSLNQDIATSMDNFQRLTKDIQEKVMKVRMLPVGPMFNQFHRYTREIGQKLGKTVKLTLTGTDTELDKTVIEKITDPLRHIVRNAIDHGIESNEERLAKGKPEEGNISLEAYHKEGHVVIEIKDDGQGLNKDKIIKKALTSKIISEEDIEKLTDEQINGIIFAPGFSTANEITDISGRGVGMDVVKNNIEELHGIINIKSVEDKGSAFQIVLPLTLSIIEGMLIKVGDLIFVLNIMSVIEIIQPHEADINAVEGTAELVNVRGEFLPLVRLYNELQVEPKVTDPKLSILVIVEVDRKKYCLMADELIGQNQVVIKSMDKLLKKSVGMTGTTILGDGKIAFIVDIPSLINSLIQ